MSIIYDFISLHWFLNELPTYEIAEARLIYLSNSKIKNVWVWSDRCSCCCCWVASVVSDPVRPHRWQPTRLPRPWDSPGKNSGVGCHFCFQCMKVKRESEVAQSCPTLSDLMNHSLPSSSVRGIFPGKSTGMGCLCLLWWSDY